MKKPALTDIALCSVLAILAHAEYQFGAEVLDLPTLGHIGGVEVSLALAVPAAIDSYVVASLRAGGRDVPWAIGLTTLSVAAGTISQQVALPTTARVAAAAVFGAVMAVVLWRVHAVEGAAHRAADRLAAAEAHALAAAAAVADLEQAVQTETATRESTAQHALNLEGELETRARSINLLTEEVAAATLGRQAAEDLVRQLQAERGDSATVPARPPSTKASPEVTEAVIALARQQLAVAGKPDYPALEKKSGGMSRSWLEKRVADARRPQLVVRQASR